jgi:SAM-dependent methyltransferase
LEKRLSIKLSTPSNILDIGCASGDWLQLWEESASLYGTELSPVFHEELANKGIQVVHPEIIEFKKYDLISMFDYLEHVECPEAELSRAYRNLKMGGYLVIGVPDMGKWQARLFGIKYYLYCPMHFSYFNRISLEKITSKIFLKKSISIFQSPPMKTNINGILKWLGFNHPLSYWSSINFPLGYSASLILVARKEA